MTRARNILFLMFDQLRWDYLSCYGHPHLHTPNIDRLAAMGVRFDNARIQSPLCGPSRMSTLTGRYVSSNGATWNNVPLKVGELTMGDHLRAQGMECWLVGKTHMEADTEGMARLGIAPDSVQGRRLAECGFDVFERDDGMRPEGPKGLYDEGGARTYNDWLRAKGYDSDNPWHDFANSGVDEEGNVLSGWFLENSHLPANIREEDSETPYMMRRGMEFIASRGDTPWCCHLSLIKPHWPYIVPAPYHDMYGPNTMLPMVRSDAELATDHPILAALMRSPMSLTFHHEGIRQKVVGAYMGLVKQIDDQVGVLLDFLEDTGRLKDTFIVLTSDHGDYLGDHWQGEKMFFHDCAVKVPMIVCDPSPEADATRGTASDALVELIDLVPTFHEVAGGAPRALDHILEGHSLLPILHGAATALPRAVQICEYDYSMTPLAENKGLHPNDARMMMIADGRWKMIHFMGGFRPMLFDMQNDPDELTDLGASAEHAPVIAAMRDKLLDWALRPSQRQTRSNQAIVDKRRNMGGQGVLIGVASAASAQPGSAVKYVGRKAPDMRH